MTKLTLGCLHGRPIFTKFLDEDRVFSTETLRESLQIKVTTTFLRIETRENKKKRDLKLLRDVSTGVRSFVQTNSF